MSLCFEKMAQVRRGGNSFTRAVTLRLASAKQLQGQLSWIFCSQDDCADSYLMHNDEAVPRSGLEWWSSQTGLIHYTILLQSQADESRD